MFDSMDSENLSNFAIWASIVSTAILALAAIFAFFLQRARYLRETDVVLRTRTTMPTIKRKSDGSHYVDMEFDVINPSESINIFARPPLVGALYFSSEYQVSGWETDEHIVVRLPPGDSYTFIYTIDIDVEELAKKEPTEFILYATMRAVAKYDGITCIFIPWSFGLRRLRRDLQIVGDVEILRFGGGDITSKLEPQSRGFEDRLLKENRIEKTMRTVLSWKRK